MAGDETGWPLTDEETTILRLFAQGQTLREIASTVVIEGSQKTPGYITKHVIPDIKIKLGVPTKEAAIARYAHRLGLLGERLSEHVLGLVEDGFKCGVFRCPVSVLINPVVQEIHKNPIDPEKLVCRVLHKPYEPLSGELKTMLERARLEEYQKALDRGEIIYEKPLDTLVVDRIVWENEFHYPMRTDLRRVGYLTPYAAQKMLTQDNNLRANYLGSTFDLAHPIMPHTLGVSLHVIAGKPPRAIVGMRAHNLGGGRGSYGAPAQGYVEYSQDVKTATEGFRCDYINTMIREFKQEVGPSLNERDSRSIRILGLIFSHRSLSYNIIGYVRFPIEPERLIERMAAAHEHSHYEFLPFPLQDMEDDDQMRLGAQVLEHLKNKQWSAVAQIGLFFALYANMKRSSFYRLVGI